MRTIVKIKIVFPKFCIDQPVTESATNPDGRKKSKNQSSSNSSEGKKDSNGGIDPGYESSRVGEEKCGHGKDGKVQQQQTSISVASNLDYYYTTSIVLLLILLLVVVVL